MCVIYGNFAPSVKHSEGLKINKFCVIYNFTGRLSAAAVPTRWPFHCLYFIGSKGTGSFVVMI